MNAGLGRLRVYLWVLFVLGRSLVQLRLLLSDALWEKIDGHPCRAVRRRSSSRSHQDITAFLLVDVSPPAGTLAQLR
ncbi:hypothetical protein EV122DRAFT_259726 [Schizophyllum commune]